MFFISDRVCTLSDFIDSKVLSEMAMKCNGSFSSEQLEELDGFIDDDAMEAICTWEHISLYDDTVGGRT